MTKEEFEAKRNKIKAEFAVKRDELHAQEREAIWSAWSDHLSSKLDRCDFKVGDFVEFEGKIFVVTSVFITARSWFQGSDVYAKLSRVKKDGAPTLRPDRRCEPTDKLKKIELKGGAK